MLPKEKSKIKENLLDYVILIHGIPKIGKSELISQIPNILFADVEGGLSALEVYKAPINSWFSTNEDDSESFLRVAAEFVKGEHSFPAICIDTIDVLHRHCTNYMMKKQGVSHPSDMDWGKGWSIIKDEFMRPLVKLAVSKYGLILISHSRQIEVTDRTKRLTKAVPTLQNYIWQMIEGFVDIILYYNSEFTENGEKRFIRTKPSERWIAGGRNKVLINADPIEMYQDTNNWARIEKAFKEGRETTDTTSTSKGILLK